MAERETVPLVTAALLEFLGSEPVCRLLSHLTGLDLAENLIRPDCTEAAESSQGGAGEVEAVEQTMGAHTESEIQHSMMTTTASGHQHRPSTSSAQSCPSTVVSELPDSGSEPCNGSSRSVTGHQGQSSGAHVRGELLCFQPGDYTLASDQDPSLGECELHLLLCFNCDGEQSALLCCTV